MSGEDAPKVIRTERPLVEITEDSVDDETDILQARNKFVREVEANGGVANLLRTAREKPVPTLAKDSPPVIELAFTKRA
jgi:hypothetical protein